MDERRTRKTNARRLLVGLGGIGYTPQETICEIVDNAVSAGAENVYIRIGKLDEGLNDDRMNNVSEYLIIDDGKGMTEDEMGDALDLGSDDSLYAPGTLFKFGLGLKSASFANSNRFELISGVAGMFHKEYVDLDEIEDEYFSCVTDLNDQDRQLVETYLCDGHGTIVRVAKIRNPEHPSISSVIDDLKRKLGVIYYYFIKENGLRLHLLNTTDAASSTIEPFDPLFVDEIQESAMLDENDWDGRTVRWLMTPKDVVLGSVAGKTITARIEMTQLPHPPTFQFEGRQIEVRNRYGIDAKNYGFYVYRNKRLISWADRLDGIIPNDKDFYSFRGRIIIDESADEVFRLDATGLRPMRSVVDALEVCCALSLGKAKRTVSRINKELARRKRPSALTIANRLAAQLPPVTPPPAVMT